MAGITDVTASVASATWAHGEAVSGSDRPLSTPPQLAEVNGRGVGVQCNSFQEEPQLAITVGGGRRKLPIVSGATENVALIGIHWCDEFIGLTPWEGSIDWEVDTWGRWLVRGSNASYDAEVLATCAVRSLATIPSGVNRHAPIRLVGSASPVCTV
jgi:hypothetical protein